MGKRKENVLCQDPRLQSRDSDCEGLQLNDIPPMPKPPRSPFKRMRRMSSGSSTCFDRDEIGEGTVKVFLRLPAHFLNVGSALSLERCLWAAIVSPNISFFRFQHLL